jgi:hypothetical protein
MEDMNPRNTRMDAKERINAEAKIMNIEQPTSNVENPTAERLRRAEALLKECLAWRGLAFFGTMKVSYEGAPACVCECDGCKLKRKLQEFLNSTEGNEGSEGRADRL